MSIVHHSGSQQLQNHIFYSVHYRQQHHGQSLFYYWRDTSSNHGKSLFQTSMIEVGDWSCTTISSFKGVLISTHVSNPILIPFNTTCKEGEKKPC